MPKLPGGSGHCPAPRLGEFPPTHSISPQGGPWGALAPPPTCARTPVGSTAGCPAANTAVLSDPHSETRFGSFPAQPSCSGGRASGRVARDGLSPGLLLRLQTPRRGEGSCTDKGQPLVAQTHPGKRNHRRRWREAVAHAQPRAAAPRKHKEPCSKHQILSLKERLLQQRARLARMTRLRWRQVKLEPGKSESDAETPRARRHRVGPATDNEHAAAPGGAP